MGLSCWLTRRRLDAYGDEALEPAVRATVELHLGGCSRCAADLATIRRLRAVLAPLETDPGVEPPEPVWDAFWPQVRARLATPELPPTWWRTWPGVARPRYVVGPAVAAAALAVLAVVAPWGEQGMMDRQAPPPVAVVPAVTLPDLPPGPPGEVVIQSIETEDPESPVMVYSTPGSDMTIVWVFGLARTGT